MSSQYGTNDRYAIAAQEDRCAPRTRLSIPAMLRPSGTKGFQTVVHDLSLSGFSALSITRMHPGTICWLSIPQLESMEARV
ncbi:MAG TPA: PilZ domain-containing protein, partial [Novosphingobium sp.]